MDENDTKTIGHFVVDGHVSIVLRCSEGEWQTHVVYDDKDYRWGHFFGADAMKARRDFATRVNRYLEEIQVQK